MGDGVDAIWKQSQETDSVVWWLVLMSLTHGRRVQRRMSVLVAVSAVRATLGSPAHPAQPTTSWTAGWEKGYPFSFSLRAYRWLRIASRFATQLLLLLLVVLLSTHVPDCTDEPYLI